MVNSTDSDRDLCVQEKLILQLYVSGMSANSMLAIDNVTRLCEKHLKERFELEIIDIYKDPFLAKERQIVFTPSLVKLLPIPKRIFIGTMSDTQKLIDGLGIINNE
jgi:circadian clock protein KaiB